MSVQAYSELVGGPLAQWLKLSADLGGDVAEQGRLVEAAFRAQMQFLQTAASCAPPDPDAQNRLLAPTGKSIEAVQSFRESRRTSPMFNHLSAVSESVPALGWVAISPAPAPYVKEMNDAGQFYLDRVLRDWREKDRRHADWTKAWAQLLEGLRLFVKQHHTTGVVWAGKGGPGAPPPPMPPMPPPPMPLLDDLADSNDRSALFAEINQGEGITKNLKRVTADMQTHKNPNLRGGSGPGKGPAAPGGYGASADKPPVFAREGKKWLVEYQKDNPAILIDGVEMNNVVYAFRCTNSTLTVKGKLNSIVLDSCKKTSVIFDSLVSSIEFINCQSVQMQVFGKVPTISVDKTDGCQIYLGQEALDVEIVSSKSSEMNVLVPKGNGEYAEYPVPEQYKTTVNRAGAGLTTVIVENKG